MQIDIITIFPEMFDSFLSESLIKKAMDKKIIQIKAHNLRQWTKDKHNNVDDKPFGGGPGMVMMAEPILTALNKTKKRNKRTRVILFSPAGRQFKQADAQEILKYDQVVMICGRYEGIDARVEGVIDEKFSIGPYVLSGGELPAMVVIESVARLLPGYLGNPESLNEETFSGNNGEYPQYTRPEKIKAGKKELKVPRVLLSGNHAEIKKWRLSKTKKNE